MPGSTRLIPLAARATHVTLAEGPERIAMEWWRHQDVAADARLFPRGGRGRQPLLALPRQATSQWLSMEPSRENMRWFNSARNVRMTAYAEIAVTTNFSFLRGASHPKEMVAQAATVWLCRHRHRRPQHAGRCRAGLYARIRGVERERPSRCTKLLVGCAARLRRWHARHSRLSHGSQSLWPSLPSAERGQTARAERRMHAHTRRSAEMAGRVAARRDAAASAAATATSACSSKAFWNEGLADRGWGPGGYPPRDL